jgi:hypothetical protein
MFISDQARRIVRGSKAVGNQNLVGLLKFCKQQTVKHVVEAHVTKRSSVPLSHACASQKPRMPSALAHDLAQVHAAGRGVRPQLTDHVARNLD